MRVRVTKAFKYAYGGFRVVQHTVGTELSADDAAAKVALAEKWGERIQEKSKGKKKED